MSTNQLTAGDYIAHKVTGYTAVVHSITSTWMGKAINIEGDDGEATLESSDLKNWKLV